MLRETEINLDKVIKLGQAAEETKTLRNLELTKSVHNVTKTSSTSTQMLND